MRMIGKNFPLSKLIIRRFNFFYFSLLYVLVKKKNSIKYWKKLKRKMSPKRGKRKTELFYELLCLLRNQKSENKISIEF